MQCRLILEFSEDVQRIPVEIGSLNFDLGPTKQNIFIKLSGAELQKHFNESSSVGGSRAVTDHCFRSTGKPAIMAKSGKVDVPHENSFFHLKPFQTKFDPNWLFMHSKTISNLSFYKLFLRRLIN